MNRRSIFGLLPGAVGVSFVNEPFSIFTGAPRQLREPTIAQGSVQKNTEFKTPIQTAYERQPLWFSGYVAPVVSPTVEGAFEWPLNVTIKRLAFSFVSGTPVPIINGTQGQHSMLLRVAHENRGNASATDTLQLLLHNPASNDDLNIISYVSNLFGAGVNGDYTPLVNAMALETSRGLIQGVKATYVPENFSVSIAYGAAIYPVAANIHYSFVTAPSSVPLSSLFTY